MSSSDHLAEPSDPIWISDIESKSYLRSRKLAGDWTLTIDAHMLTSEVFSKNSLVYDDGSFLPQLSFFRIGTDCSALEWDTVSLNCRIWIRISEVTESEIEKRLDSLRHVFSSYVDFKNCKLLLEEEPNVLVLGGIDAHQKRGLMEVVRSVEQNWRWKTKSGFSGDLNSR